MTDAQRVLPRHSAVAFILATLVRVCLAAVPVLGCGQVAYARVILVGAHRLIKVPSQAATVARDGDRVVIDPGTYQDCSVWRASRLTIEAAAPGVTIAGKVCYERGIFVTAGAGITVRGIIFARARGLYHTGAGIFALGADLTVENSQFLDNENGILAGGQLDSRVRIVDSTFRGNGSCEGACAHGVYAGAAIMLLDIERCRFLDTRTAHHVKSRARNTIVVDSEISDGDTGTSSYLIDVPDGGNVLIQNNVLRKGARSSNVAAAISIGVEGVKNPTQAVIVRDNRFASDLPEPTIFVRNSSAVGAELSGNQLAGKTVPLRGPGSVNGQPVSSRE